jgi:hypothetical protein
VKIALFLLAAVVTQLAVIFLGFGAIQHQYVVTVVYWLTVSAALLSIFGVIASSGRMRCIWWGCAIFGLGYLLSAVIAGNLATIAASRLQLKSEPAHVQFYTTMWFAWLYDHLGGSQTELWTSGGTRAPALRLLEAPPSVIPKDMNLAPLNTFIQTGHCAFTWLAALFGAMLGGWLYDRERIANSSDAVIAHPLDRGIDAKTEQLRGL